MTADKPTSFLTLMLELQSAVEREARANEQFEHFIATCDPAIIGSLPEALKECQRATRRIAEVCALMRDLMPFEDEVRAIAARGAVRSGNAALASATVIVDRDNSVLEGGHPAVA